jgi:hypothetical protein
MAIDFIVKEENRRSLKPVVVWGIELSKENIRFHPEQVIEKVVAALKEHGCPPPPPPRRKAVPNMAPLLIPVPEAIPTPQATAIPVAVPVQKADHVREKMLEAEENALIDELKVEEPESAPQEMQDDDLDSLFGDGSEEDATPPASEESLEHEAHPRGE